MVAGRHTPKPRVCTSVRHVRCATVACAGEQQQNIIRSLLTLYSVTLCHRRVRSPQPEQRPLELSCRIWAPGSYFQVDIVNLDCSAPSCVDHCTGRSFFRMAPLSLRQSPCVFQFWSMTLLTGDSGGEVRLFTVARLLEGQTSTKQNLLKNIYIYMSTIQLTSDT